MRVLKPTADGCRSYALQCTGNNIRSTHVSLSEGTTASLAKKKSIIDTQPHSQPQLQQNGSLHWALTFLSRIYYCFRVRKADGCLPLFLRLASSHVSWRWGFCWSAATCMLLGCLLLYMWKGVLAPPQPLFLWSRTTFVERSTTIDTFLILSTRIICLN